AAGLLPAVPAVGSTVSRSLCSPGCVDDEYSVDVSDTHGEQNDLLVTQRNGYIVVHERGYSPLKAGEGCSLHPSREVWCTASKTIGLWVDLSAGDDRLDIKLPHEPLNIGATGGGGDDRISAHGGSVAALLFG